MELEGEFRRRSGQRKGSAEDQHAPHMTWDPGIGKEGVHPAILPMHSGMGPGWGPRMRGLGFPWPNR